MALPNSYRLFQDCVLNKSLRSMGYVSRWFRLTLRSDLLLRGIGLLRSNPFRRFLPDRFSGMWAVYWNFRLSLPIRVPPLSVIFHSLSALYTERTWLSKNLLLYTFQFKIRFMSFSLSVIKVLPLKFLRLSAIPLRRSFQIYVFILRLSFIPNRLSENAVPVKFLTTGFVLSFSSLFNALIFLILFQNLPLKGWKIRSENWRPIRKIFCKCEMRVRPPVSTNKNVKSLCYSENIYMMV